jgi:hypothetical protein
MYASTPSRHGSYAIQPAVGGKYVSTRSAPACPVAASTRQSGVDQELAVGEVAALTEGGRRERSEARRSERIGGGLR